MLRPPPRCFTAQAHADAAAARGALQHHRADRCARFRSGLIGARKQPRAWQQRHAVPTGDLARRVLQTERPHLFRRRTDEGDARRFAGFGETPRFRSESRSPGEWPPPRSFRAASRIFVDIEIALRCRRGPQQHRFAGLAHMQRMRGRLRNKPRRTRLRADRECG